MPPRQSESANRVSLATAVEIFLPHWATREFGYKLMKKAMSTAAIATGILFSSAAGRTLFQAKRPRTGFYLSFTQQPKDPEAARGRVCKPSGGLVDG